MKRIILPFILLTALCLSLSSCGTLAALVYLGVSDSSEVTIGSDPHNPGDIVTVPDDYDNSPEHDDTEKTTVPEEKPEPDVDGDNGYEDNIPPEPDTQFTYDVQLIAEGERVWKFKVARVEWESGSYTVRLVDEFGDFIKDNPDWTAPFYDDSDWKEHTAPFGDRVNWENANETGWTGENHGIFLRTDFELSGDDLERIANGSADLAAYMWYDNTCHIYINGVEVFAHDDSYTFVDGVPGETLGGHDWNDAYEVFYLSSENEHYVYGGNVAKILNEGNNTVAVSLCDCWGGREFDLGLYVVYN